jgi:hypothetical protein
MADAVVIGAAFAQRYGYGGHAWALLQYALGFRQLGLEVTVLDRLEPEMLADPGDQDRALGYVERVMSGAGLGDAYVVLDGSGETLAGLTRDEVGRRLRSARFLLNVMGFIGHPDLLEEAQQRIFLDIDPGFGQMWRELGLADVLKAHDRFVTVGRNVGAEGCSVPTCGVDWVTIPHPVVLDGPPTLAPGADFTSVGSWRGPYAPVDFQGHRYGLRVHQFRRFADLPRATGASFRLALEIDPADEADRARLSSGGWVLVDPREVAFDPAAYTGFIEGSLAEFTVAKDMYVETRSGWLGDRTACYLAAGKPCLVQDTWLAPHYPLGEGLLAFSTTEEAAAGVAEILKNPVGHGRAARRLAERELDASVVLGRLLEELS